MLFASFARNALAAPLAAVAAVAALAGAALATPASADVRVAFTGDQGVGENARAVLRLIADEGTDLLLIQGDLGYNDNSAVTWERHLNEALGRDFPVLTLVGNHENFEWPRYQRLIRERLDRVPELSCDGDVGVRASCRYDNLDILQVSPGIHEVAGIDGDADYASYLREAFAGAGPGRWRICGWHKNMNAMQPGNGRDSTGWEVFDACLDAGAMVAMAHEHAYSRTHLLDDFRSQSVVHTDATMRLEPGRSFAFVSGLGGREVRAQGRGGDHFASIYTATQGATHGALFCDFGRTRADCRFKTVDGAVPDRFTLELGGAVAGGAEASREGAGFVFSRTDTDEYRWVAPDGAGSLGNVWIDETCAARLGGPAERGDWQALQSLAPGFDTVASPCDGLRAATDGATDGAADGAADGAESGYVFARTDKREYRWIDRDGDGTWGSVWIDASCAERLGGASAGGDWGELMDAAPGFDAIDAPCD